MRCPWRRTSRATGLIGLLLTVAWGSVGLAQTQIEPVPDEFDAWIAPRLAATPAAIERRDPTAGAGGADGVVLLDEQIFLVRADGGHVVAEHRVVQAATPRGAERLARIPAPFLSSSERISLARARRISPDGRVTEMRDDLAFVQTPQVLRDCEHYSEIAELVLLFPRVRPGDAVEYVVVKEAQPTIPGEFTMFLPVADPWPIRDCRRELLLPRDMGDRLTRVPLGIDAEPDGETVGGLSAFRWELGRRAALALEPARAPIRQAGPGIWVSTLRGWDDVARWYAALAADDAGGDASIAELAATLTRGAQGREEIVAALHQAVAREVDYVGIEFGMARLRPKPPETVWGSRFGDCKDQAQLLRALLRHAGIDAHLALVNTAHRGRIEMRAPDFRQFDHVIVAVPEREGGYLFCDPSQAHLRPGELGPSCRGRKALVVRAERAEWVDIPCGESEQLALRFELELDPYGGMKGWMRIEADGYQGRMLIGHLGHGTRERSLEATTDFVGRFFEGVEVVDVQRYEQERGAMLGAYFTAQVETEWRGLKLRVPHGGAILPGVETCRARQTAFYQPLGRSLVEVVYELPEGWGLRGEVPAEQSSSSVASRAHASWSFENGSCLGRLEFEARQRIVPPSAFPSFAGGIEALREWLATPLRIAAEGVVTDSESTGAGESEREEAVRLPRLPTGAGQLRLVDVQYPRNGDLAKRREALVQVRRWFAEDAPTALQAGLEIAVIDQVEGESRKSLEDIRALLDRYGSRAPRKLTAWAEYLMADALREIGQKREALGLYQELAREPGLSPHRRGWAYLEAARVRAENAPLEAMALLDEALRLDSPALCDHVSLMVHLLCQGAPVEVAQDRLQRLASRHPHRSVEAHRRLIEDAAEHLRNGELVPAKAVARVVTPLIAEAESLSELRPKARCLERSLVRTECCLGIARRIESHLSNHAPPWWDDVALDAGALGRDRLVIVLQQLDRSEQARRFVRGTVELISRWQVAPDFFGFLLWRCAEHLEGSGLSPELAEKFRAWSDELPEDVRYVPQP
jgi:transglutaminase-like putative cysteine protease/tetratricopeptide (TPR) repeat protein